MVFAFPIEPCRGVIYKSRPGSRLSVPWANVPNMSGLGLILGIKGNQETILANMVQHGPIFANMGSHGSMLANMGDREPILANMGAYGPTLASIGDHEPILANMGDHGLILLIWISIDQHLPIWLTEDQY